MTIIHSSAASNAATNAVTGLLGSGAKLKFRLTGTLSSPGTAVATLSFSATPFASAVGGIALANAITQDSSATGNASPVATATLETSGGTVVVHCSVAAVGGDINLSNGLTIAPGDVVTCSHLRYAAILDRTSSMMVGMNVGYTTDYAGNFVFANLLRNMRPWRRIDDGSDSHWSSQVQGQITGATGTHRFYSVVITPEAGLASQTLKFKNTGGNLIAFTGSTADPGSGAFATTDFDVPYTAGGVVIIQAKGNVSGTMACLLAGHETSYAAGNEFSSDFLAFHAGLKTKVLRFMDGSATNTTYDETWSDRTVTTKVNFQGSGGIQIPYEVQADAANRIGADLWVNVPPRASTSTYTPSLASLLFSNLNASRSVYVERGNEVWNTGNVSFAMQTEYIRRFGHTKFAYTCSGTTFTKTAHGFSNDQLLQSFAPISVSQVGVNSETQLVQSADNWVTATSYTAGQYIRQGGNQYICLTSHTSGTFATDLAANKWVRVEWYYLMDGRKLYVKVLTANTFELWSGAGGTGTKAAAPSVVTSMIGLLSDEFGVIADEAAALNTQYAQLALADWTAFDTAFGGTSRVKANLGSQAAGAGLWTAQRLAVTGVAARCNHVHIAPYHNGVVWGGKVVPASGKITPYFWTSNDGATGHCSIYTSGSTPTLTQRKAGTGTGFQARLTPMTVNSSGRSWTVGADVTIADGTYKVYMDFVDPDGLTWTVTNTVIVGAGQPTVDFIDTDANQQLRDLYNIEISDLVYINQHKALIAASGNPAITVVNYEGGSHQDYYPPDTSGLDTWYRAHRKSATYGVTLKHYYNALASSGIKLHCHYMDVSGQSAGLLDTPWRLAESYSSITDNRYLAASSFGGLVPARTLVDFGTVDGGSIPTAPGAFPSTFYTFSDASLTYQIVSGNEDGNYAISGANVQIVAQNDINWAVVTENTLKLRATDGFTDAYFDFNFTTNAYPTSSFDPSTLFASAQKGFWYDPADFSTLFQDTSGTTPVTAVGQSVGKMLDKSGNGAHIVFTVNKPVLDRTAGCYSLVTDGSGKGGETAADLDLSASSVLTVCAGLRKASGADADSEAQAMCFADFAVSGQRGFEISAPDLQSASGSKGFSVQLSTAVFSGVSTKYVSSVAAPITRVLTATLDRTQATVALQNVLRLNGVTQTGTTSGSAVSGSFTAGKVILFVRNVSGNGNPFKGNFYGAICRAGTNSGTDISNMENWVGARSGFSL